MTRYLNMFFIICLMASASMLLAAEGTPADAKPADVAPLAATPADVDAAPADQSAQTNQTAQSEQAKPLQATIRSVKGIVQYRTGDDQPWQKVNEGDVLDVGVEFRTGPRSAVTFHLPPDQLITLDRLGTLKLLEAINNKDKTTATTELGMRYGRTRYQVEGAQGVEHHATIRSPSATLAIRGTEDVTFTDQRPGPASASTKKTRVFFRRTGSPTQVVFGSVHDSASQMVTAADNGPAQYRDKNRIVDTSNSNARSRREYQILNDFELYNGPALTNQNVRNVNKTAGRAPTSQPSGGCGGEHSVGQ